MPSIEVNFLKNENPIPLRKMVRKILQVRFGSPLDGPIYVWIDITNECNLRCIMCPQSKESKRKKMMMGMDIFMKIIDEVYKEKPAIFLHVSGEPLLHKNLIEMIEYAKSRGCYVVMHTNATLLTEELSRRILNSRLDLISFSFDGCSPEIYEKLRVGANFYKVRTQIETFLRLRHEMGLQALTTRAEILYMKETKEHIDTFIKYWQSKRVDRIGIRIAGSWLGLVDDHSEMKGRNSGHRPCSQIFSSCAILVDGTVVPCCIDCEGRLPLGNILEQPFSEIWDGYLYSRLRRQHLKNTIPENSICYDCPHTKYPSNKPMFSRWFMERFIWSKSRIGGSN